MHIEIHGDWRVLARSVLAVSVAYLLWLAFAVCAQVEYPLLCATYAVAVSTLIDQMWGRTYNDALHFVSSHLSTVLWAGGIELLWEGRTVLGLLLLASGILNELRTQ